MIAAIYARKSTEQVGADADAKSVTRQIDHARAFAATKGWGVADIHIYADDAVSGADTRRLIQRQRLLDALAGGPPPFHVLIMRDASRFSRRDGDEAFGELKRMVQAGIDIWFYQDGTRFTFGTLADNVVGFVRAEMNAEYRRQIAKWTREAMVRKAQAGHVTGGRVFGYDNVRVDGHVERRINEAEAAVVRRIFDLSASGCGYTRIAKALNADRTPSPRPNQKRWGTPPTGWSPSTVYEVLHRPLYHGRVIWNKTTKRNAAGERAYTNRPESEWLQWDQPGLQIVPDDLWRQVHDRLSRIKTQLDAAGHGRARRSRDIDSKYLLSGFARCAVCGGTLSAIIRNGGRSRFYAYGCLAHSKRGATICSNALVLPVDRVEAAVIARLTDDVLHPAIVRALVDEVFAAIRPHTATANVTTLRTQLQTVDAKITRLTAAVEEGAAIAPLVRQLQARQAEREALVAAITSAEAVSLISVDRRDVERRVLARIGTWRERLAANGREVLRDVLDGPLRFTPDGKTYRFEGDVRTGELIAGLVGVSHLFWRALQDSNLRPPGS